MLIHFKSSLLSSYPVTCHQKSATCITSPTNLLYHQAIYRTAFGIHPTLRLAGTSTDIDEGWHERTNTTKPQRHLRDQSIEEISVIPYGCTMFRISEFPVIQ